MQILSLPLALLSLLSLGAAAPSGNKMDYVEECARGCIRDAAQDNLGNLCPDIKPGDFECMIDVSCPLSLWKCPCANRDTMVTDDAKDCVIGACGLLTAAKVKGQMVDLCEKAEQT